MGSHSTADCWQTEIDSVRDQLPRSPSDHGTERPIRSDHERQNSSACATVSIESFDVEPVDHRRLFRWLLGLVAAVTGVLAIIGWPLPAAPGRYVTSDAWERTTALIEAWWTHDGWRMSGASWFWGGVAMGATTGAIAICAGKQRTWRKAWLLTVLPGGVIAALGPLVQVVLGIPWSNYSQNHDARSTIIVYVIGLALAVGLPFLQGWVMHGRERSDGDGALRR